MTIKLGNIPVLYTLQEHALITQCTIMNKIKIQATDTNHKKFLSLTQIIIFKRSDLADQVYVVHILLIPFNSDTNRIWHKGRQINYTIDHLYIYFFLFHSLDLKHSF